MDKKPPLSNYARYSAIGLQMAAMITAFALLGKYLDGYHWVKFPLFTVLGILFGVFGSMYYLMKKL